MSVWETGRDETQVMAVSFSHKPTGCWVAGSWLGVGDGMRPLGPRESRAGRRRRIPSHTFSRLMSYFKSKLSRPRESALTG